MRYIFFLLIGVSLFTSCITVKPVEVTKVESVKLVDKTLSNAKVEVTLKINNPNKFKIKVKEYDLEGLINGKSIGKLNIDKKLVIAKKSEKDYTITVGADLSKATGVLAGLMIAKAGVINLKGDLKVKVFIIKKKIPIDVKEKFSAKDFNF